MKLKVLFIYPTPFRITGLPVGLASLTAVLKGAGYQVKIFDTAFYRNSEKSQTEIRSERMMSKEIKNEDSYLPENEGNINDDLINYIHQFKPDIVGISILETMFGLSQQICETIKKQDAGIPIIAGGVFPTLSPEIVIQNKDIDIVCRGEGETALLELCRRITMHMPYTDVEGLWVKKDGTIYKNKPSKMHDINLLPIPDFSEFDPRLFIKPMQGRMYKMVNIETSRGCYNNCTYCAAPQLRKFFKDNNCGRYDRNLKIEKVIEQIRHQIKKYKPEFIYFSSENFLAMNDEDFSKFVRAYETIKIPFWIQTRIETITENRISEMLRVGMHWMTIGLEHGNEEFRRKVLKRHYSNTMFLERMQILKKFNIGASLNNMIGFPFETRELVFDTINMNRQIWQNNHKIECNVFLFTPFAGCELYTICKDKGYLGDIPFASSHDLSDRSVLSFSEEFHNDLQGIIRTFNLYVKLPEEYYPEIRIAEKISDEGNVMLRKLSKIANS